jgi:hypothetical protein
MSEIIVDGTGKNYAVKADVHNRLSVYATTVPRISFISQTHGTSFMVYAQRDLTASNELQPLICFHYTGEVYAYIDKIIFSTDEKSDISLFELYANTTYMSGGTPSTPVNLNLSSKIYSDSTCNIGVSGSGGELSVGYDEANEFLDVRLGNGQYTYTVEFDSAFILSKNTKFGIFGSSPTIGTKLRASIYYFEELDINQ